VKLYTCDCGSDALLPEVLKRYVCRHCAADRPLDHREAATQFDMKQGMQSYQNAAVQSIIYDESEVCQLPVGVLYPALNIASEAGEVAGKFAKLLRDRNGYVTDEDRREIGKEIGDVLWCAAVLAKALKLNLGHLALGNIDKVTDRVARGVVSGSGDNR
jgi:NTP pyrophosphatase (non-canonical NTP hydrolase)